MRVRASLGAGLFTVSLFLKIVLARRVFSCSFGNDKDLRESPLLSKQSATSEADGLNTTYDDVIQYPNIDECQSICEAFCELFVRAAGFGVA